MKILQLIHSLNPGGAERLVVDLSNQLSNDSRNDVVVMTLKNRSSHNEDFYQHELSSRVQLLKMNFEDGAKISYLLQVSKSINEINPDVVHVHCQIHYIVLAFFLNRNRKFIYTLHNRADILLGGVRKYIAKLFSTFKRFKIVSISDSNRHSLRDFTGIGNDHLVYNGRAIPEKTEFFNQTKIYIDKIKSNESDIVFLAIAKCSKQKNLSLLIQSVNKLAAKNLGIKLLVIGDNYASTDLGRQLINLAGPSIHFLGTKNNVADYFYASDAFCLSSIFEGMPITLLEAFACGCIPISTPVSGSTDIIEDGITGFISPDFSEESYTKTLERFISLRCKIDRNRLKKVFLDKYSIETCADTYSALYKN